MSTPAYLAIKTSLLDQIHSGALKEGDRVPSESRLVQDFGVARMTANRALRELTKEQVLYRVQGAGTFVAAPKYNATLVEIRNIADEIRDRGHEPTSCPLLLEATEADKQLASEMDIPVGTQLFFSRILHLENGMPVQLEFRWVNAGLAPDYLAQDFTQITPNHYLTEVAPLQKVDYRIEALLPDAETARQLHIGLAQPCLKLHRRTWSQGRVASIADLWHPGSRYQFTGNF